jgi:hypothetical protein
MRVWVWLSVAAILVLPGAQLRVQAPGSEPALLKAMELGLRSITTSYHSRADCRVAVPSALNRVKRFAHVCAHGRGIAAQAEFSSRPVMQSWKVLPASGRYFISTPRSPPAAQHLATC